MMALMAVLKWNRSMSSVTFLIVLCAFGERLLIPFKSCAEREWFHIAEMRGLLIKSLQTRWRNREEPSIP